MAAPLPENKHLKSPRFVPWEPYKGAVQPVDTTNPASNQRTTIDSAAEEHCKQFNAKVKIQYDVAPSPRQSPRKLSQSSETSTTRRQPVCGQGTESVDKFEGDQADSQPSTKPGVPPAVGENVVGQIDTGSDQLPYDKLLMTYKAIQQKYDALFKAHETLTVEHQALQDQLQHQGAVNDELKGLLVASMGDDLQIKLDCVSETKVKLASDVVKYTQQLTEDNEHIDKLLIQCDVWRTKYLASSVIADELVGWKMYLISKFEECQTTIKNLLDEQEDHRKHLFNTFMLLKELRDNFIPADTGKLSHLEQYHTLYDLITGLHSLADALNHRMLNDIRKRPLHEMDSIPEHGFSEAASAAKTLLHIDTCKFYNHSSTDEFDMDTMKKQGTSHGLYPATCNYRNITYNCCKNCEGHIKVL